MPARHVLIIDDEPVLGDMLGATLREQNYDVQVALTGAAGQDIARGGFDGVVLVDLRLPDANGLDLVEPIMAANPRNRVVILTAHATLDAAMEATRRGAYDFLTKTEDLVARVNVCVKNAFRDREMASRVNHLEQEAAGRGAFGDMVYQSPQMVRVFETVRHVLDSRVTVLLLGESGTGKEVVARGIHQAGPRAPAPFVAVNCAGIPDNLLESELFGHERGAFTGAVATKIGKFELADRGTVFLDEIGEMPLHLQSKILRVIETRQIERVGGGRARDVDVRIISATHRDLPQMVADGTFREDLFYRLDVFPVRLPRLVERDGDVVLLAHHFMRQVAAEEGKSVSGIGHGALGALEAYDFPGNVRELHNIVSRAVLISSGPVLTLADLPPRVLEETRGHRLASLEEAADGDAKGEMLRRAFDAIFPTSGDLASAETVERELIRRALALHQGNVSRAARALGMSRATMYRRLGRFGGKRALLD